MPFNRIVNPLRNLRRPYSGGCKFIDLTVNDRSGIATVTLKREPVNSLSYELVVQFLDILDNLEKNKSRGMILTSALDSVFCAGLDIMELYKPQEVRSKQFGTALQDVWLKLHGSSFPTVAVINGHSPGAGCQLAMSCEYRIMVQNFTIGLNETKLGFMIPKWFISTFQNTIGRREAELALLTGRLFTSEEALKISLVDELADDKDEAIAKAYRFFDRFAAVNTNTRQLYKEFIRKKDLQALVDNKQEDLDTFWFFLTQPWVQQSLRRYLEVLKTKSK